MKRKKTGERELHLKLWEKKKIHFCQNCDKQLSQHPNPAYFSHIIPKGKEPSLRLDPNNFKIVCFSCHELWEFGTIDKLKDYKLTEEQWKYLESHNYLRYCKLKGL